MKLVIIFAVLGLAAVSLAQEKDCPDEFSEKFDVAKKECKTQLGIAKPSPRGGDDRTKMSMPIAAGLKDMKSVVRKIRQISFGEGEGQNTADRENRKGSKKAGATDEQMKPMADCLDGKLKGNEFYDSKKAECVAKPTKGKDGSQDSQQRCLAKKLNKACNSQGKEGGHESRGKTATQVNKAAPQMAANATSLTLNGTQVNTTNPLPKTTAKV